MNFPGYPTTPKPNSPATTSEAMRAHQEAVLDFPDPANAVPRASGPAPVSY